MIDMTNLQKLIATLSISVVLISFFGVIFSFITDKTTKKKSLELKELNTIENLIKKESKKYQEKDNGEGRIGQVGEGNVSYSIGNSTVTDKKVRHYTTDEKFTSGLELLDEYIARYHDQALSQSKAQFWVSIAAAIVGFAYILIVASFTLNKGIDTVINIVPGTVLDAVAYLFFRQAENTSKRATALYDRLRADNQFNRAKNLVADIENKEIQSLVRAQIALHTVGMNPKEINLQSDTRKLDL